jgi:hypothetical protein
MRVLIGCESSGKVREEFRKRGHYAMSCDLLPTSVLGLHYQGDIFDILDDGWDLLIVHPPCTYLCSSGLHWNHRTPGRAEKTEEALLFVERLLAAPIEKIALENPTGCISTRIQSATQYIQPYEYGHNASKKTGLWLKNLPALVPTQYVEPRLVEGRKRWSNQTDSGQNKLSPGPERWKLRSETYQGIAEAMAAQWG